MLARSFAAAALLALAALPVSAQTQRAAKADTVSPDGIDYVQLAEICAAARKPRGLVELSAAHGWDYDSTAASLLREMRSTTEDRARKADMFCGNVTVGMDEAAARLAWGAPASTVTQQTERGTVILHIFPNGRSYAMRNKRVVQVTELTR